MTSPYIFVADDDQSYVDLITALLITAGYLHVAGHAGDGAFPAICGARPDLVLLDIDPLHAGRDWSTFHALRMLPATQHTPVILCSTTRSLIESMVNVMHRSDCQTLKKPFVLRLLLEKVAAAIGPPPAKAISVDLPAVLFEQ